MKTIRRILLVVLAVGVAFAIWYAMQPQPSKVDVAQVSRGTLRVTVDEDGKTRIKERYVVSAPLAGRLLRIDIKPGDAVTAKGTQLASIEPSDPQLLNPRELASAEAREKAAEASLRRADPAVESARAELNFAETDLARKRELAKTNSISEVLLQEADRRYRTAAEAFRSATFAADIARFELEQARAALMPSRKTETSSSAAGADWRFAVESPIRGRVLRVFQESSAVVTPGAPLLEIGDPTDIELEIDVLSSDAVKIVPGQEVSIEHWGGEKPLHGSVRVIEPSAFTKISALGVEEQRVNVIVDIVDPIEARPTLGDGFRVEVRIVVWEGKDILKVPASALFREGDDWLVFLLQNGKAVKQTLKLGHRNTLFAEVLEGLHENDTVIVHPSDAISDGVDVVARD